MVGWVDQLYTRPPKPGPAVFHSQTPSRSGDTGCAQYSSSSSGGGSGGSNLFSITKMANPTVKGINGRKKRDQPTLPFSLGRVSITMMGIRCSQTIRQKSLMVKGSGP